MGEISPNSTLPQVWYPKVPDLVRRTPEGRHYTIGVGQPNADSAATKPPLSPPAPLPTAAQRNVSSARTLATSAESGPNSATHGPGSTTFGRFWPKVARFQQASTGQIWASSDVVCPASARFRRARHVELGLLTCCQRTLAEIGSCRRRAHQVQGAWWRKTMKGLHHSATNPGRLRLLATPSQTLGETTLARKSTDARGRRHQRDHAIGGRSPGSPMEEGAGETVRRERHENARWMCSCGTQVRQVLAKHNSGCD